MGGKLHGRRIALAAVAGLGLIVAGCGDDGTSGERPPDGGAPATAPAEEFGSEARGEERAQIVASFDAYMSALSGGDYEAACDRLTRQSRDALERAGSKQGGDCPQALAAFSGGARQGAALEIEQVRVAGDTAQVIFIGPGAEPQRMRMSRQGGEWKAGLLSLPLRPPSS